MNVAYVVWLENLNSPILRGQVIEVLKKIGKLSPQDKFYFLAFQPIQTFLLRNKDLRNIRRELKEDNIRLILIPSFLLLKNEWFSAKWIPLIFIQSFPILLILTFAYKIDVLHCRSYPITLAAIKVKKLIQNLKIIFDPRSPFPEENITSGMWKYNSLSYKLWKHLEKKYLKESDITIAIANTYIEHFKRIYADTKFEVIPNNADVIKFTIDKEFRNSFRKYLGIDTELLFVYSGSLGNRWNNPKVYAKFIIKLRELDTKHNFLFLTKNVNELRKAFDEYGVKSNEYFVFPVHFDDMPKYLSAADFGLNLMERQDIRVSIKTVEYLAMGLPVIINSNVLGANEIVEQHGAGFVIEDIESIDINMFKKFLHGKERISSRCRNLACEKFSTEYIARRYIGVYN